MNPLYVNISSNSNQAKSARERAINKFFEREVEAKLSVAKYKKAGWQIDGVPSKLINYNEPRHMRGVGSSKRGRYSVPRIRKKGTPNPLAPPKRAKKRRTVTPKPKRNIVRLNLRKRKSTAIVRKNNSANSSNKGVRAANTFTHTENE